MKKRIINFGIIYFFAATVFAQNSYVDSLINWTEQHPKIDSLYIQTLHRISYRLSEKDVKKSFDYYVKVASLSDSLNFTFGKSLAQINLGILLSNSASIEASNNAYLKAIDYAEACGALRLKAISLNNVADNYFTLKSFDNCKKYTQEAININTRLKAWRGVAINYELLNRCSFENKLYNDAKNYLLTGMPFAIEAGDSYVLAQFYLGFGKLHAIANNKDSAIFYFTKAMDQASLQNDVRNEYDVYIAKAGYLKNISSATKIRWLHIALTIAKQTSYMEGISNAAQKLSQAYDGLKNKDSSFFYYGIYRSASDSVFSESNRDIIINKESELMIKKQETENIHLKELAQLQSREISEKNKLLLAVVISLLLVTAIAFFINRSIQLRKTREEASLKQKIAETQMLAMRSQMNPHFIFNSINSIENFIMQDEKRLASDYLNKFSKFIRSILDSSSKDLVSFDADMKAMQLYIDLEQLRYNNKFSYLTHIDPELMNGDYRVPSLLIQPYLENAIVHGIAHSDKAGLQLSLTAFIEKHFIKYIIEDNGIGRKQASLYNMQNKPNHISEGLKTTEERIAIFNKTIGENGNVEIIDLLNKKNEPTGTRVEIKIMINKF